jgi:hypothetical protein
MSNIIFKQIFLITHLDILESTGERRRRRKRRRRIILLLLGGNYFVVT